MADLDQQLLKGNTSTLILAVLRDNPLHGYGIAREIELRSGNILQFKEGTLYPALHALERDACIESEWQNHSGRQRKVYRITPEGRAILNAQTQTWNKFASAIHQVIEKKEENGQPQPEPAG